MNYIFFFFDVADTGRCVCTSTYCILISLFFQPGYLLAARFFMCVSLVSGVFSWIISIIGLLQHKARWLLTAALCYTIQGQPLCFSVTLTVNPLTACEPLTHSIQVCCCY